MPSGGVHSITQGPVHPPKVQSTQGPVHPRSSPPKVQSTQGPVHPRSSPPKVQSTQGPVHPRSSPAVGVETNIDQSWIKLPTLILAEPEPFEGARAITVNQNVGGSQEFGEPIAVVGIVQIKPRAPFANGHFEDYPRFVPARRIDAQNVRSEGRQESCCDRTGENALEIKNAYALQRASRCKGNPPTGEDWTLVPMDQRLSRYRLSLGMVRPFLERPHRGSAAPRFNNGHLEFVCLPLRDGGNYRLSLLRRP